jgi:hypothetical protein
LQGPGRPDALSLSVRRPQPRLLADCGVVR